MKIINAREMLNKVFGVILIVTLSLFVLITLLNYRAITSCDLADKEAEAITLEFSKAINIQLDKHLVFQEPRALHYSAINESGWTLRSVVMDIEMFLKKTYSFYQKEPVKYVLADKYKFRIGCKSKAIKYFFVEDGENPSFDYKALGSIFSLYIDPQKEMIFEGVDKSTGTKKAEWSIALNGYKYYKDGLTAFLRDKEKFTQLWLDEDGTICPTNVEIIDKDKALELAWNRFIKSIDKKKWKITGKGYFDIESVDLFIVTPEKIRLPFRKNPSRLAWVISFVKLGDPKLNRLKETFSDPKADPKDRASARKAWEIESRKYRGIEYPSEIKIDAETGKAI